MSREAVKKNKILRLLVLVISMTTLVVSSFLFFQEYKEGKTEDTLLRELSAMKEKTVANISLQAEKTILEKYRSLHEKNPDLAGWIKIPGTNIDYPVMYTADDFYLYRNFNKEDSKKGTIFIDKRNAIEPRSKNILIYGHNMKDGSMFADIMKYRQESFFREHPKIYFDTMFKEEEYEIVAVFKSKVYKKGDKVFKFYNHLDFPDIEAFDEYARNIKKLSLYETGVTPVYGDSLITLITCSSYTENGRFAVVARKIN